MSPVEYDALSKRVEKSFSNGLTIKGLADHIASVVDENPDPPGAA